MKPATTILQIKGRGGFVYPEMSLKKFMNILLTNTPSDLEKILQDEFKYGMLDIVLPQIEKYRALNAKHTVALGKSLSHINKLKGEIKNLQ